MRTDKRVIEQLRALPLFRTCTDRELALVAGRMTELCLPAGTTLIREGTVGREFFVIVGGSATVRVGDRTVATLGAGDFAGELALLGLRSRTASVVAETELVVQVCSRLEFGDMLWLSPNTARGLLSGVARRLSLVGVAGGTALPGTVAPASVR